MSERSEVKRDGAKAQKNSGRGDYQKGDAQCRLNLEKINKEERNV